MYLFRCLILFSFLLAFINGKAQSQYLLPDHIKSDKIKFELVNNVMLIPVEVNGLKLKFLLDTGVSKPIVFNFLKASDSLKILNAEKIKVRGLGNGEDLLALRSSHNTFKIGNAVNKDQGFFAIFDSDLNFAPKLGEAIDGIIGFDIFKDFVVEINYNRKFIKLFRPYDYKMKICNRCEVFDLEFGYSRPFMVASVSVGDKNDIPVKLLVDSGNSDALWLFENTNRGIKIKRNFFIDYLGAGLSGSVHGKRTKIKRLKLGAFNINKPKAAFPDSLDVEMVKTYVDRDGSVGGEILKRFNCVFDYTNSKLMLKPNGFFKAPFSYNKSGLLVENRGVRMVMEIEPQNNPAVNYSSQNTININGVIKTNYKLIPSFIIYHVIPDSPADKAGLMTGDEILFINNKRVDNMSLDKLLGHFYEDSGEYIKILVNRNGFERSFKFQLKSPLE